MKSNVRLQPVSLLLVLFALLSSTVVGQLRIRYQSSIRGGLTYAGNSLIQGTNSTTSFDYRYVNNSGGTRMSSSSDLVLPPGSTIVKAVLYVESYYDVAGPTMTSVKFKVPGQAATTLTTTTPGFLESRTDVVEAYYQFVFDVTNLMPANGYVTNVVPGGEATGAGRYSVGDPEPFQASNWGYGWCLMVVYANPNSKYRNITVADQPQAFGLPSAGGVLGARMQLDIPGITVPSTGAVNALLISTGCWGEQGAGLTDEVRFGIPPANVLSPPLTRINDPITNSNTDVMNGSIGMRVPNNASADGATGMINGNYTGRNPYNTFTNTATTGSSYLYDCDLYNASGILPNSATPITVRMEQEGTASDALGAGAYGVSVDIAPVKLTKSVAPASIPCGGTATYTFTIANTEVGAVNQANIAFTDLIPSGLVIANPNGVVKTGGTGGTVTAASGTNTISLTGLTLAANQTCTITVNVTNVAGQFNPSCAGNPAAFTNGPANITSTSTNLGNGVQPVCLTVDPPSVPTFAAIGPICSGVTPAPTLPATSVENIAGTWNPAIVNTSTTTTYTFTPANAQCASTATLTITVNPKPTPQFTQIPAVCEGATINPLPTSSNDSPAITGIWTPAPNNAATTTYTFTPSAGACANTTTMTITINPKATPTFSPIPAICAGTNPAPALQNPSNESIPGSWNPAVINTTTAGSYTFTPNPTACANTASITVSITPKPTPTFTPIAAICEGNTAPALQTPSIENINGTWNPATIDNTTTRSYTFTPATGICAETATITVTITPRTTPTFDAVGPLCEGATATPLQNPSKENINGSWSPATMNTATTTTYSFNPAAGVCANSATLTIAITPKATPTFNAIPQLCSGQNAPALQNPSNENISGTWNPATIDNQTTRSYTFTPASGACANSATITVAIGPPVIPQFDPILPFCEGTAPAPALETTSKENISGTWNPSTVDINTSRTYTFTPTAGLCAESTTLNITVNPKQAPQFDAVGPYCKDENVPALPTTSKNNISGDWSPAINNQSTTTYTFTPNPTECANTFTLTVTINPPTTPTFDPIDAICAGDAAPSLPINSTNSIGGTWNPNSVDNMATKTYTFTPTAGQCAESTTLVVTVSPGVTVTVPPATTCSGVGIQLNASGASTYVWTPATGLDNANSASPTATVTSNTTYKVVGTSTDGCTGETDVTVTVATGLTITVNPTAPTICKGEKVTLTASGAANYTWSPATDLSATNTAAVDASPTSTITYTVNGNTSGCLGSTTVQVTVTDPTLPTFDPINSFCAGSTAPSLPTQSKENITGTWNPSSINNSASGVYTFTPDPTFCAQTTTLSVTVTPSPTLNNSSTTCDGTNTNFTLFVDITGGTTPFSMTSNPAGAVSGTFSGNTWTSNPLPSGTSYDLTFVDANGCGPVEVAGIRNCSCSTTIGTMDNATIQLCATQSATGNYNSAGEVFDANDIKEFVLHTNSTSTLGTIITRNSTPNFNFVAGSMQYGTTYYISAIAGNDNGGSVNTADPCLSVSVGQPVVWFATPTATASANPTALCVGSVLNLTGTSSEPNSTYSWTFANGTTNTTQNPTINSVTAADGGTYTLIVTSNNCSSAPATVAVQVDTPPTATPSNNGPLCVGQTLNLQAVAVPGGSYSWSGPGFNSTSQNPSIVNVTAANAGTYSLTITLGTCTSTTQTTNVVVNPIPVATITPSSATICAGQNVLLTAGGSTSNNYTWSANGGSPGTLSSTSGSTVTATPNSTITIDVVATDNGCSSTASSTITVNPIPTMNPITDIQVCENVQVNVPAFGSTPAGATTYAWTNSQPGIGLAANGNGNIVPFNGQTSNGTTTATISVTPTRNGCTGQALNFFIRVNPLPTVTASATRTTVCEGEPINLQALPGLGQSYNWTYPNGSGSSILQNPTIAAATQAHEGTFNLQLSDNNGCPGTGSVTVTVNAPETPVLTQMPTYCINDTQAKVLSGTPAGGTWSGTGIVNNNFVPSVAGIGTHTLTYEHFVGCGGQNTMEIIVYGMPSVDISGTPLIGCSPLSVTFNNNVATSQTMNWNFGNGQTDNALTTTTAVFTNPGTYDVTVTNTENGCSTTRIYLDYVTVENDPLAQFDVDNTLIYKTDPTVNIDNTTIGATSYSWNFGDGTQSTATNPSHTFPDASATYEIELTATSAAGCVDVAKVIIQVRDELVFYVPNTFTPDGDQFNNTFVPVFASGFDPQNYDMFIYNRWGELIFETHNPEIGWDGTYQGKLVKEGIYNWVMKIKDPNSDKKFSFEGHVFMIR